nr:unnamed protein product [Digitaria exilis]
MPLTSDKPMSPSVLLPSHSDDCCRESPFLSPLPILSFNSTFSPPPSRAPGCNANNEFPLPVSEGLLRLPPIPPETTWNLCAARHEHVNTSTAAAATAKAVDMKWRAREERTNGPLPLRNMLSSSADDVWFWSIRTACRWGQLLLLETEPSPQRLPLLTAGEAASTEQAAHHPIPPLRSRKRSLPPDGLWNNQPVASGSDCPCRRIYLGFGDWGICGGGGCCGRRGGKEEETNGKGRERRRKQKATPVGRLSAPPQPSDQDPARISQRRRQLQLTGKSK